VNFAVNDIVNSLYAGVFVAWRHVPLVLPIERLGSLETSFGRNSRSDFSVVAVSSSANYPSTILYWSEKMRLDEFNTDSR
jgi:hypothetical protein